MDDDALLLVLTTLATRDEALALGRAMVEARLAACAQVEAIASVYRWQGAVQQDDEWRLLLKTTAARHGALEAALRERHPYTLPAIVTLPVTAASPAFAAWVAAETAGE